MFVLRNPLIILWELPVHTELLFSAFNIFVCDSFIISWCGFHWFHHDWSPLSFLNMDVHFLLQILTFGAIIASNTLASSLSPLGFLHFFHSFFLFLWLNNFKSSSSLIFLLFDKVCCLPSIVDFSLKLYSSAPKFVWSFLIAAISLLIFSCYV